ncbi:unnamed protein product, partial [Closterium sp. NIES-54]
LTVDLLEERLTAAEKSILAVGDSCGDPRAPFFEGCSLVPLLPSVASAAAVDLVGTEEVGAASAPSGRRLAPVVVVVFVVSPLPPVPLGVPLSPFSPLLLLLLLLTSLALRRSGLRLLLVGGAATVRERRQRVVEGTVGAAVEAVEEAEGVAVEVGVVAGVGASVAAVRVLEAAAAAAVEAAAAAVEAAAAVVEVAAAVVLVEVQPRSVEALVVASASSTRVPVRPRQPSSFVSGTLGVGGLGFPDAVELPRWGDLLRQNVAIFDLDFDAILAVIYALTDSAKGDCYLCVPPDPGIEAAALGASESAAPGPGCEDNYYNGS